MNKLSIDLEHCYGIPALSHQFDFSIKKNAKAYAIYAPNGIMKTSFAKTFDALAKGNQPEDERFNIPSHCSVKVDGAEISADMLYVLRAETATSFDGEAMTNILVDPVNKKRYDEIILALEKSKGKLLSSLQTLSKWKKADIEATVLTDWKQTDFPVCIELIKNSPEVERDLTPFEYSTIFDSKALQVLASKEFVEKANEFNKRYQELFELAGTIYQKGVFNPSKAEQSFSTLQKQGFFDTGHRIHLKGDSGSIDNIELQQRLKKIHESIDGDEALKKLRDSLAKNAQTQALTTLLETLSPHDIEYLLENIKPDRQEKFRQDLWSHYVSKSTEADTYLELWAACKDELADIEAKAKEVTPLWQNAVKLFNTRFIDMPFSLSIANTASATLGREEAKLLFTFRDGKHEANLSQDELKTLSQGERRAAFLLNLIFEVELRKRDRKQTLFIFDDIADSFDYKNKQAITQYLQDISQIDYFYQIILTHNFDFYRSILYAGIAGYEHCLMASRTKDQIVLHKAEGIKNYFTNKLKNDVMINDANLCASIPFSRNLIEFIRSVSDDDYRNLTSLLHWKKNSKNISVQKYLDIFNQLFGTKHKTEREESLIELILKTATEICNKEIQQGLNLEDKIVLSIAIRIQAEIYLTDRLREVKGDPNYWYCDKPNQFQGLLREYSGYNPSTEEMHILNQVSVTVSTNIHLNSFMYEPIIDLSIEHLIELFRRVKDLESNATIPFTLEIL